LLIYLKGGQNTQSEDSVVSGKVEYLGLCSTCKNAPGCTFPRDPNEPVLHCEEFYGEEPSPIESTGKDRSPPTLSYVAKERESAESVGLCGDCEDRETCMFPKLEGGIWHCEEYR